jgi:uncharacterized protein YjbJ (UPF0337 family)
MEPSIDRRRSVVNKDEAKGRVKEAAGDLTDDKGLKREGKVDRAAGKAKGVIDKSAEEVRERVHSRPDQ